MQAAQVRSFDSHSALMENSRLRLLSETQKTQLEEKLKHQKRRRHWRLAVEAHNASFSLSPSPYVHESCVACLAHASLAAARRAIMHRCHALIGRRSAPDRRRHALRSRELIWRAGERASLAVLVIEGSVRCIPSEIVR
jgi:hypothetical protein